VGHSLRAFTRIAARWPRFTLAIVILLSCVSVGYTFFFLKFKTDRSEFVNPDAEFHKRWTTYTKTFGDSSDVIVAVEGPTVDGIKEILDDLGARLQREPELFSNILYKFDSGPLQRKWLQYATPEHLHAGLRRVNAYAPVFRGNWSLIELEAVFARLEHQIDTRLGAPEAKKSLTPDQMSRLFHSADLLTTSLDRFLANPNDFRSPWPQLVPLDPQTRALKEQEAYSLSDGGSMGFLRLVPKRDATETSGHWRALTRLREINAEVAAAHPGSKIGLTGAPALEAEELERSRNDLAYAIGAAVLGCLIVLVIGFRGIRHPLLGLLMVAAAVTWTLGLATEMVGHLSVFSLSVVPILVGLGIDYAIIYTSRYLQFRRDGWQLRPALMETTRSIGAPSIIAALTAALAFLCTMLTDFIGISELGLVAAAGILLCALAAFFVLPALIALADENVDVSRLPHPFEGGMLRSALAKFPLVTLGLAALVVVAVGSQIVRIENRRLVSRIRFDSNFLNLHAEDAESVRLEHRLFSEASDSVLHAVSIADSERQMRELHDRFAALPSVGHVEDLAMRLPGQASDATRQLLAEYRSQLAGLPQRVPSLRNADPAAIGKAVEEFYLRVKKHSADPSARRVTKTINGFLNRFEKLSLPQQLQFFNEYQYHMASDLLWRFQTLRYAANDEPIQSSDLPPHLISRYVSAPDADGKRKWLIEIHPRERIWDEQPLARFVSDLRSVDPHVTGTPIQNFEAALQIQHSYRTASFYAFAVVWIILLLSFLGGSARWLALLPTAAIVGLAAVMLHTRHMPINPILFASAYVVMTAAIGLIMDSRNLRDAILAFFTPMIGMFMMFGVLCFLHVDLNPANLLVLPLVLGIGVNNGVQILHDYRSQKGAYRLSPNVFSTVVLTALTSIVGFGSMMIASHRGLFSLGVALSIGILSCLFVAIVLLPAFLSVLSSREAKFSGAGKSESSAPKRTDREQKARAA
jgi:hypothetical protein